MQRYAAPQLQLPQISLNYIPKGYRGTQKTVEHVQALIQQGAKDFYVRQKAIDILLAKAVQPKDYRGEIKALFEWVQRNIRYTKDPFRVEVLHSARRLLELRAGDCDDMTILLGSMLEAIGHPVRLVLTGPDPLRPQLFSHIYLEANHQGRWVPLDATMPYPMGWEPQALVKQVIPITRQLNMKHQLPALQGMDATTTVEQLRGLIQAIRQGKVQAKDNRVKLLWNRLRQKPLFHRNVRSRAVLRFIWFRGLSGRPYPQVAQWLTDLLQRWNILPKPMATPSMPQRQQAVMKSVAVRAGRPVAVRPMKPVTVKPIAQVKRR
jgi:hypothetical protein